MTNKKRISSYIETENDTLVYRVTGEGKPILFIAGGGGDGDLYLPLVDKLSSNYKCITYDRRANARSTMNFPNCFDLSQQARDAYAILNATGEESAVIFGNSSGAIIALEMARLFPDNVIGVIAHEAPIARLHPDSEKWLQFFEDCYNSSFKFGGASMASTKFMFGIEVPAIEMIKAQLNATQYVKNEEKFPNEKRISSKLASKYLIEKELIKVTHYVPDLNFMREHRDKYVIAVGTYAQQHNSFLFQISKKLSEELGIKYTLINGHHASFMNDTTSWAESMKKILDNFYLSL